jgi:putative ABC transport system permease protein
VDQDFVDKIAALPGVARTAGVLLDTLSLEENEVYGIPTMGIADGSWLLEDYQVEPATVGSDADEDSRRLMLGLHLAQRVGVSAGDTVMMFEEPYLVTGIFESRSTWENGSMIMPLESLQELTDRSGQVTYINVVLEKPVDVAKADAAIRRIQQLDAKLHALTTEEFVETDTRMQLASAMAWMTSMIALVIGAIGTLNTMMTSVLERTQEIGILRAIGWPRWRVVTMILLESCALALFACIIGCVLAVLLTWALSQASAAKGILSPTIDVQVILQGFALALGIGVLGAMIPAWRAARMLPTEAFRIV